TSTSTAGVADGILLIAQELLVLHNDSAALPTTCEQLKSQYPRSPSGYYILASANGSTTYIAYCNMGLLCGSGGGWTRLAYLDMSDDTQNCPSGFRLYQSGGVRACGRPVTNSGTCASVQFPSNGISYSQICGRVTGYQYGSPDAVRPDNTNIDSPYVDGVSITRGSPRQHVWTLMAGSSEASSASNSCPCNTGSSVSLQSFIGNNYFCESGTSISIGHLFSTHLIHSGMVKVVVLMKHLAALLQGYHGFTETMVVALPLLTILS
uniref:Fibrinogen C-terminal domain-containing protein n=1 Tax=Amphimedon queenslandica TaxID=400682 RepID=A0A1X7UBV3_AMPQE